MGDSDRWVALVDELRSYPAETEWFEFKVNNYAPEEIAKRVSGLSNAAALVGRHFSYMVWGIQDCDHQVVGTTFQPSKERYKGQPLELWLANIVSPSILLTFACIEHPQGRVVVLEIPCASSIPTKFNNIAFLRIGSATPKLGDYPDREAALLQKLRPFVWERGIAASFVTSSDVLSLLDSRAYFAFTNYPEPRSSPG